MRALSIRQPWAWAILHAGKRIENRDWSGVPRAMIGQTFLIHAAKGCTQDEYLDAYEFMRGVYRDGGWTNASPLLPPLSKMPRGAIVGRARLTDVIVHRSYLSRAYPMNPAHRVESSWYVGPMGLVLDEVEPLPVPVPFKGALGFFEVPEHVLKGGERG